MLNSSDLKIVFENDSFLVVDKPFGMPSQTTRDPNRVSAEGLARAYCGAGPCFLVHRLDADTSGILVFAKSKAAVTEMTESLRKREWTKVYWAITAHFTPKENAFTVENHLKPTKAKRGQRTISINTIVRSGGDYALTEFSLLARGSHSAALIEARPKTGRMHQIRVHLASLGMPIVGDPLYGKKALPDSRLALHATRLNFSFRGESFDFVSRPPEDFADLAGEKLIDITSPSEAIDALRR